MRMEAEARPKPKLGRGFRFLPSDEILVGAFLYEKLKGTIPESYESFVKNCDLYNREEEPWQIWERFRDDYLEGSLYFFTTLKKKSTKGNGSRIDRTTGSSGGCWHAEDSGSKINTDSFIKGDYVAIKKRFTYRNRGSAQDGLWIMFEYSLELGQNKSTLVLCQLRKNGNFTADGRHKRKSVAKTMVTNSPALNSGNNENHQSEKRRKLQTETECEIDCYRMENRLRKAQEQPAPMYNDHNDECESSANISRHQIIEEEEAGLCDPGAESLNELLHLNYDFSHDYFPDFTRGLISVDKFLNAPCDSKEWQLGQLGEDDMPPLIEEDDSMKR